MSIYYPTQLACLCGNHFEANLARSINIERSPEVREKILKGEFHRVVCPSCGNCFAVENAFYYTDLPRNSVFLCQPRNVRYCYKEDSKLLKKSVEGIPFSLSKEESRLLRVVYGLDELREKIVAQDAQLDDRIVELLKILIFYEHPFLIQKTRLQLFLTGYDQQKIKFIAYYHNSSGMYEIIIPRGIIDDLSAREDELRQWVKNSHKNANLFNLDDSWVNFRRWTTRYTPLEQLKRYAEEIRAGQSVSLTSEEFNAMLQRLPRGNQLSGWAKKDLRELFLYAKAEGNDKVQDALFEVRFGLELEDEWAQNSDPNDIDTIWQLLRDVPITNIEGNTKLREIDLIPGGGGYYHSNGTIQIGQDALGDREYFEDVLRHEVGHAVHEQRDAVITPWLQNWFGWQIFTNTPEGVQDWVLLMGGWGNITSQQRSEITDLLISAAGPGSQWTPGPSPYPPAYHPWWGVNFGPRLAYENTGANWYENFRTWHHANGKAFFINYWYAWFMAVDMSTLDYYVANMPDNYAAMSHFEFFAELYALYYDHDDPQRSVIGVDVANWLNTNVGVRDANNPRRPNIINTLDKNLENKFLI